MSRLDEAKFPQAHARSERVIDLVKDLDPAGLIMINADHIGEVLSSATLLLVARDDQQPSLLAGRLTSALRGSIVPDITVHGLSVANFLRDAHEPGTHAYLAISAGDILLPEGTSHRDLAEGLRLRR